MQIKSIFYKKEELFSCEIVTIEGTGAQTLSFCAWQTGLTKGSLHMSFAHRECVRALHT